jgi:hypothetical protein
MTETSFVGFRQDAGLDLGGGCDRMVPGVTPADVCRIGHSPAPVRIPVLAGVFFIFKSSLPFDLNIQQQKSCT